MNHKQQIRELRDQVARLEKDKQGLIDDHRMDQARWSEERRELIRAQKEEVASLHARLDGCDEVLAEASRLYEKEISDTVEGLRAGFQFIMGLVLKGQVRMVEDLREELVAVEAENGQIKESARRVEDRWRKSCREFAEYRASNGSEVRQAKIDVARARNKISKLERLVSCLVEHCGGEVTLSLEMLNDMDIRLYEETRGFQTVRFSTRAPQMGVIEAVLHVDGESHPWHGVKSVTVDRSPIYHWTIEEDGSVTDHLGGGDWAPAQPGPTERVVLGADLSGRDDPLMAVVLAYRIWVEEGMQD